MINKDLALFCYPWDVIDEGYDAIINAVKGSGLNSIYITVNYHSGMFFLPHSLKRKIYFPGNILMTRETKIIDWIQFIQIDWQMKT